MNLNRLDQRITLQTPVFAPDNAGGRTQSWQNFATVWAHLEARPSSASLENDTVAKPVRYTITLRARTDITKDMRVLWGGSVLSIDSIQRDSPRDFYMTLLTTDRDSL